MLPRARAAPPTLRCADILDDLAANGEPDLFLVLDISHGVATGSARSSCMDRFAQRARARRRPISRARARARAHRGGPSTALGWIRTAFSGPNVVCCLLPGVCSLGPETRGSTFDGLQGDARSFRSPADRPRRSDDEQAARIRRGWRACFCRQVRRTASTRDQPRVWPRRSRRYPHAGDVRSTSRSTLRARGVSSEPCNSSKSRPLWRRRRCCVATRPVMRALSARRVREAHTSLLQHTRRRHETAEVRAT